MRKHLVWVLGLALALGVTAVASADNTQSLRANFAPTRAPKLTFQGGKLHVVTKAGATTTGAFAVKPATKVFVYFDNDIRFNTTGIPSCRVSQVQDLPTAQARAKCRSAIIGGGKATAYVSGDPNPNGQIIPGVSNVLPGVITAFNGPKQGGRPTIILHTRVDAVATTTALTGVLSQQRGDLGNRLLVTVPPLPASTALGLFDVTVGKRTGRNQYVSARCRDANRTLNYKGIFNYDQTNSGTNGVAPRKVLFAKQRCTVKPPPRRPRGR